MKLSIPDNQISIENPQQHFPLFRPHRLERWTLRDEIREKLLVGEKIYESHSTPSVLSNSVKECDPTLKNENYGEHNADIGILSWWWCGGGDTVLDAF